MGAGGVGNIVVAGGVVISADEDDEEACGVDTRCICRLSSSSSSSRE